MLEPTTTPAPAAGLEMLRGLSYGTILALRVSTDEDIEITASGPNEAGKCAGFILSRHHGRRIISTTPIFDGPDEARAHMARILAAAQAANLTPEEAAPFVEKGKEIEDVVEELEQKAIQQKFEPYHCQKTPKGWKIHVPLNTILDFDGKPFIVRELSKKQITMKGEKGGLPVGKTIHIFEGRFFVAKSIQNGPNDFTLRLRPKEGTFINPKHLAP